MNSLLELPYIMLLGLVCGVAVAGFIRLSRLAAGFSHWPVALRFSIAGCVSGALALFVPEVLGIGYDTLELTVHGNMALSALLVIALCKLVATAISCGVGMPVGLIGPNLLIGACIGGVLGSIGASLQPELASDQALYVIIGMGAAMGAVLNAPLAAILAVIELTQSIQISVAAMLAIVTATLANSGLFHQKSVYQAVLAQQQRQVPNDPLNQLLHDSNVQAIMDTRVVRVPASLAQEDLEPLLESAPVWCLVEREGDDLYLVSGKELLQWLANFAAEQFPVDLTEADIRRRSLVTVPMQASLRQALDTMRAKTAEAACIAEHGQTSSRAVLHGVVTRDSIEQFSLGSLK